MLNKMIRGLNTVLGVRWAVGGMKQGGAAGHTGILEAEYWGKRHVVGPEREP